MLWKLNEKELKEKKRKSADSMAKKNHKATKLFQELE
jgi:hypothetical protein